MAKTGTDSQPGTAEGAALGRALHARHAPQPVLDDDWAVHLLSAENRDLVLSSLDETAMRMIEGFDASPIFAVNVGCLRYAEDEIERCIAAGMDQYLLLGAGLDSFALRRDDLRGQLSVYEVDHPDMQALKRQRIADALRQPAMLPEFIAVDFESEELAGKIGPTSFDPSRPAVVSWLNTIHYLTADATARTLRELSRLLAPGSRLILNYSVDVELTAAQSAFITRLLEVTKASGEPFRSRWTPADFEELLRAAGFAVTEHATEEDLNSRYFAWRSDGLVPGIPLRIIIAERLPASA